MPSRSALLAVPLTVPLTVPLIVPLTVLAVPLLLLGGCTPSRPPVATAPSTGSVAAPAGSTATTWAPSHSGTATTAAAPRTPSSTRPGRTSSSPSTAARVLARMSVRERVGQLLMVDCPTSGVSPATSAAITDAHAGSVILDGTSSAGADAADVLTSQVQSLAPPGVGLFVATDQEGGDVQRLAGTGFSTIPTGTEQGRLTPTTLRADAQRWGAELRRAGVNLDLAPVLDTVPPGGAPNPPIGDLDRQYGDTPETVTAHGLAFAAGMHDAGIDVTVKHFPGLGRVRGNTDTTSGVTDAVTTATDPYVAPFAAAIRAGVPFVMMSTADYSRLDPGVPAAFSRRIVTGLLRDRLGFRGVVISDDLGHAAQVSAYSPGQRAVRFVAAGGDIVLTVVASQAAELSAALVARAGSDPAFRAQIDAAALRVLQAKQAAGLLRA